MLFFEVFAFKSVINNITFDLLSDKDQLYLEFGNFSIY